MQVDDAHGRVRQASASRASLSEILSTRVFFETLPKAETGKPSTISIRSATNRGCESDLSAQPTSSAIPTWL